MLDRSYEYVIVFTTVASEEQATAIATSLLNDKLAACINIFPVQSLYTWKGEMAREREWQLIIKTRQQLFSELSAKISSLHEYEVPEIIIIPVVDGSPPYLQWLANSTKH